MYTLYNLNNTSCIIIIIIYVIISLENRQTSMEVTNPTYDTIPDKPVNVEVTNPTHLYDTIADKPVRQTDVNVTNQYDDTIADKKPVKEPVGYYAEVIIPTIVKMQPNPAYAVP